MANNYSATAPMTKGEHIVYYILYWTFYCLSLLPFRVLYLLSSLVFIILYHGIGYRKKVVRQNLTESFPEKSDAEIMDIEQKFYRYFCDYIFETIKLTSISKESIKRHMIFNGMEIVEDYIAKGHNVALYLAHYCNWEWVTSIALHVSKNIYGGQVYHVLENKVMDRLMLKIRSRMGSENIERNKLLRKVVQTRKEGKYLVIGFISDQGPEMHNIHYWTQFLNHETAIITGTETLAKKCDFSCVYLDITRVKRGYYEVNVVPLADVPTDYPDYEITEKYTRALENNIRRQPEFWLWTHKRWKRTREMHQEFLKKVGKS